MEKTNASTYESVAEIMWKNMDQKSKQKVIDAFTKMVDWIKEMFNSLSEEESRQYLKEIVKRQYSEFFIDEELSSILVPDGVWEECAHD